MHTMNILLAVFLITIGIINFVVEKQKNLLRKVLLEEKNKQIIHLYDIISKYKNETDLMIHTFNILKDYIKLLEQKELKKEKE